MELYNEPKFVTTDEFYNMWGIDLNARLKGFDNVSNKGNTFLANIERSLMEMIDARTNRNYKYEELQGRPLKGFKKAILYQAMYVYRNGDISMDSGYDPSKGPVESIDNLEKISYSQRAIQCLVDYGLYNHNIYNRRRYTRFY